MEGFVLDGSAQLGCIESLFVTGGISSEMRLEDDNPPKQRKGLPGRQEPLDCCAILLSIQSEQGRRKFGIVVHDHASLQRDSQFTQQGSE